jgi:hypothetical protein
MRPPATRLERDPGSCSMGVFYFFLCIQIGPGFEYRGNLFPESPSGTHAQQSGAQSRQAPVTARRTAAQQSQAHTQLSERKQGCGSVVPPCTYSYGSTLPLARTYLFISGFGELNDFPGCPVGKGVSTLGVIFCPFWPHWSIEANGGESSLFRKLR